MCKLIFFMVYSWEFYCRSAEFRNTEIYVAQRLPENETIIAIQQILRALEILFVARFR